jgi:hypothetical protein
LLQLRPNMGAVTRSTTAPHRGRFSLMTQASGKSGFTPHDEAKNADSTQQQTPGCRYWSYSRIGKIACKQVEIPLARKGCDWRGSPRIVTAWGERLGIESHWCVRRRVRGYLQSRVPIAAGGSPYCSAPAGLRRISAVRRC